MFICAYIGNFIADVHVPVYAGYLAGCWTAAANIEEHACLAQRVLFIVGIVIESLQLRAEKLLGPMALLTSLLRGTQVVHRGDWPRKFVEGY